MTDKHAIFDPGSCYSHMRARFLPGEKLRGYFHWRRVRAQEGWEAEAAHEEGLGNAPTHVRPMRRAPSTNSRAVPSGYAVAAGSGPQEPRMRVFVGTGRRSTAVTCVAALNDGRILFGIGSGALKLWNPAERSMDTVADDDCPIRSLATYDEVSVAIGRDDGTVQCWNFATHEKKTMAEHTGPVHAVAVDRANWVVSGSDDGNVKRWNPATDEVQTMPEKNGPVNAVAVDGSGRIISGSADGTLKRWNPATGQVQTMAEQTAAVTSVADFGDGRMVSAVFDGPVKLWSPDTNPIATMSEHLLPVTTLAILPDGRVASGSHDRTVRIWEPSSGDVETAIEHLDLVSSLAVTKNGEVVSGGADGTVRLWDPATRQVRLCESTIPVAAPHVQWQIEIFQPSEAESQTGDSDQKLVLQGFGLPGSEVGCRIFLLDKPVLLRLREACPELDQEDDERALQQAFADHTLRSRVDVARLLAAVPDLDVRLNAHGFFRTDSDMPPGTPPLQDDTYVVVVVDRDDPGR